MTEGSETRLHVMLATDDSGPARVGEEWVSRLRFRTPPLVEVVCVAARGMRNVGWRVDVSRGAMRDALDSLRMAELRSAQRIANDTGERLQAAGLTVHAWARQGDVSEELLAMIAADQPDLVVAGPRGRSGLAVAILGSVTQSLVAYAEAAVLVARPPVGLAGPLPRHALLVARSQPEVEVLVTWLLNAGWLDGAQATILGLLDERVGLGDEESGLGADVERSMREDAVAALEVVATRLTPAAASVAVDVRGGHPLTAALDSADALEADLIVAARPHRRPGHDAFAEKVARHATTSVLLVPVP